MTLPTQLQRVSSSTSTVPRLVQLCSITLFLVPLLREWDEGKRDMILGVKGQRVLHVPQEFLGKIKYFQSKGAELALIYRTVSSALPFFHGFLPSGILVFWGFSSLFLFPPSFVHVFIPTLFESSMCSFPFPVVIIVLLLGKKIVLKYSLNSK